MKAILIIDDMPNGCYDCQFRAEDNLCLANGLKDEDRSLYCPLKPMPQKKIGEILIKGNTAELVKAYRDGFNECIDEILGEKE